MNHPAWVSVIINRILAEIETFTLDSMYTLFCMLFYTEFSLSHISLADLQVINSAITLASTDLTRIWLTTRSALSQTFRLAWCASRWPPPAYSYNSAGFSRSPIQTVYAPSVPLGNFFRAKFRRTQWVFQFHGRKDPFQSRRNKTSSVVTFDTSQDRFNMINQIQKQRVKFKHLLYLEIFNVSQCQKS